MELYREIQHIITPSTADFTGRWRIGDIFRAMQEAAEVHVKALGCGYEILREANIAWILIRTELSMQEYPKIWDDIVIATWTGEERHSIHARYFEFRNLSGKVLGKAVTLWALMDIEKRCILSPEKSGIDVPKPCDRGPALPFPGVPRELKGVEPKVFRKIPVYTDYDINGHVNNTRYIDWVCDLFELEHFRTHYIDSLIVNYSEEIRPGTELTLLFAEEENRFSLRDCPGGKSHFTISGSFAENAEQE